MSETGQWRSMKSAPRDGTKVLVEIRASEQGPAEIDLVRWGVPDNSADEGWVSAESDLGDGVFYGDGELTGWAPATAPLSRLRAGPADATRRTAAKKKLEVDGSGI